MKEALKELDEELGGFGRFQKWIFFLACLAPVMTGISVVNQVFVGLPVRYSCESIDDTLMQSYEEDFLNFTTPFEDSLNKWSSCQLYSNISSDANSTCDPDGFDSSHTEPCSQWVYDRSLFSNTLVTEFDLTCDKAWMQALGGSLFMFGMPFGALLLGDLADRIGRRKGLVVSVFIMFVSEVGGSFAVNYYMYLILRFTSGIGSIAAFQTSIILALEVVSSEWRTFCGMFIKIPFAIGETSVAAFAYFIRDWRWLQLIVSLPSCLLLSYWWILPESIRWLLSKGRYKEAKKIIQKAALMNKVEISSNLYDSIITEDEESKADKSDEGGVHGKKRSVFDLFKSPRLRNRTFILIFSWIVITHNFYGLSSNSANFGGNVFINFVAIMFIEVPSYVVAYLILDRLGRKGTLVFLLLTGGASCFIASMINEVHSLPIIILSIGGKFCTAAAFAVVYIYTIEIFPTPYRSLGLGLCSMSARIGGIIAPFTAGMGMYYKPLPLIIFGVISLLCGTVLLFLPETLGSELPQTLEQSEKYGINQPLCYFTCCRARTRPNKVIGEGKEGAKMNVSS